MTVEQWRDARWQRAHCVQNTRQLHAVYETLLPDSFYRDIDRDQAELATMSLLLPPYVLNTMVPAARPDAAAMYADPVRRHMLPAFSDRDPEWPSHPHASRDSLHEAEMWAVEGLTHRYPTKVLAELLATCPQYCGHCTRMDLVGNSTAQVRKLKFSVRRPDRLNAMLRYIAETPGVRDVVVSGGDIANVPWPRLEEFVLALLDIDHVRDIRLASKALIDLPQHWLTPEARNCVERLAKTARDRAVALAIHTHVNAAQQLTPLGAQAARTMLDLGVRDVRNQGVLLRGVNDSAEQLLDLCFALLDGAGVLPYYFYLCDMIPNAEHWRLALHEAQDLQQAIMGYLPGFATPRVVCDVPFVGKRWVHQAESYDRERGVSTWTKNYRTALDRDDPHALGRRHHYYDPVRTLGEQGRLWWRQQERVAA
ncbi:KamA family radical SAM protein [Streptomyces smaragdinus]|uniref:KamA family radical SAM protein n=1 Tax=Streptomyces smaragdinus TaxID=2585196 RepID=UPI002B20ABE0|nr:lysine 2,3-aminomutase [Streptomyces smaragdinus]